MLYAFMLLGIGFLTACLFMAMLAPVIHERAVRLTVRRLLGARPRSRVEMQAQTDQLRAQFAMTIRRLEMTVEETQAKAAGQLRETAKLFAEIHRLKAELRKSALVILRFQARELMRRSLARRIVKLLVYLFDRWNRQNGRKRSAPDLLAKRLSQIHA
jgi:hypothetical protein